MAEQQPRELSAKDKDLLREPEEGSDALTRRAWQERRRKRLDRLINPTPTSRLKRNDKTGLL